MMQYGFEFIKLSRYTIIIRFFKMDKGE